MTKERGRWLLMTAAGTLFLACGLGWAWMRPAADPVSRARDAYVHGDWEAAAVLARERLRTAGEDVDALRLLARSSVRLGRDQVAMELFRRVGSEAMSSDDLFLLGVALHRAGNRESSLKVLEQARAVDPDRPETLFELTRGYLARDRLVEATETGRRLASHAGWEARAEWLLGVIQRERSDPVGAVALWQRAIEHETAGPAGRSQPVVSRKELARALLRVGRPGEARQQLQVILAEKSDPEATWLLGRAALQDGDWAEARAAWEKTGSFRDENPLFPEPAPFVGSGPCAQCHGGISHVQQSSRHARTFFRASDLVNLDLPAPSFSDRFQPSVTHTLWRPDGGRLQQETRVDGKVFRAVVEYAFGSGDRGMTLVGRDNTGQATELRLSYYPNAKGPAWDVTSGHPGRPSELERYLGQPLTEDSVRRCLLCHVTDHRAVIEASGPGSSDRGIGCEKCHGPGGNHLIAVHAGFPDLAIARPTLASGMRAVKLCAECHSPRGRTVSPQDTTAVRFQGSTLTWSRCFLESNDSLDCTTCHDPHRNVVTSAAHYEAKCLSCHSGAAGTAPRTSQPNRTGLSETSTRSICPVNQARGCIGCHMPTVKEVVPHSSFTDHFIRVHRD